MRKLLVFAITITTLLASPLLAQDRHRDGDRDRGSDRRDDRREMSNRISAVVRDCDQRATDFRQALARALDRSRLNGTRREDRLNEEARGLDKAISRLRESWNREHDVERSRRHVAEAIEAGRKINWALEKHAVHGRVQGEWAALRTELNMLAEVFRQPQIRWER